MRIIEPSIEVIDNIDGEAILRKIELCGRVCYKSEANITPTSARQFVTALIKRGHESVLEHVSISVRITCDRGVSHEIVRHRLASYSQESTRYCNYSGDKFDGELTFIKPCFWVGKYGSPEYLTWLESVGIAEHNYTELIGLGVAPQEARSVLPNSLKTELIMTADLREWRHFLKLRTAKAAHPQMRQVAGMILAEFKRLVPVVFDDIEGGEDG